MATGIDEQRADGRTATERGGDERGGDERGGDERNAAEREGAVAAGDRSGARGWLHAVPSVLRTGAYLFLFVGFAGAYVADESPVGADSVYSLVFFAGVGCGVASIYLGIYLQDEGT